jgi:transposase
MMAASEPLSVVYDRCCGLDVHKRQVQACLLVTMPAGTVQQEQRSFGTMSEDLLELRAWLLAAGCTCVAMESTGSYWKPIQNMLEGDLEIQVVNAAHIKQVPGRKTDVADAAWIAGLLRHGLLRASFIPERAQRELRDLTRYRMSLVDERSAAVNRLQKFLEDANLKVAGVASDMLGVSGRAMLDRIVAGETDAASLAQCARGKLRAKIPQLEAALAGSVRAHHRWLLARVLTHIDELDALIAELSAQIAQRLAPYEELLDLLDTIPGIGRQTAENLLAEIGTNMSQFPDADHLASWAGMTPGNNESAGKRKRGKTRKGSRWLRASLVVAAHGAGRTKDTALAARYRALAARRGSKRAAVAVGHAILLAAYHILTDRQPYDEHRHLPKPPRPKPPVPPDELVQQLQARGFVVTLTVLKPAV